MNITEKHLYMLLKSTLEISVKRFKTFGDLLIPATFCFNIIRKKFASVPSAALQLL